MKEAIYKCEVTGDLLVTFATAGPITERDWTVFLNHLRSPTVTRYLGASIGATEATSVQRKSASDLFKSRRIPVVVVTDASLVRGIVTAVSWLGVNIKAFDWPEIRNALEHLKVTGEQQDKAIEIVTRLRTTYTEPKPR